MRSRNLDYSPDTPPDELGAAAVDELLERGDFKSWAPIAQAVRTDPHGALAEVILNLCQSHKMYGTSYLWRTWIERLQRHPGGLASIRRGRRLTQQQLAERLGISQSDVSKLERRGDQRVSTLRAYVEATGGKLQVKAVYPDTELDLRLDLPAGPRDL